MTTIPDDCPVCEEKYPDICPVWQGLGNGFIFTGKHCEKCGTRLRIKHNCITHETTYEVLT